MRLLTPLGLLGLIGVLLLILIYVLKPKYQERTISSTFVWKLSLKYKKQKLPFQWLKSSLIVILQFLILGILTFAMMSPILELDSKSGEKIVILDASANMLTEHNGRTRFERAVQEIGALADSTTPDHRFTVILAARDASFIARRLDSSQYIKQLLSESEATYESADMDAAISLTEGVLAENPEAEIILFTGNQYSETGAITVRNMADDEWNVAILDFSSDLNEGYYEFTADVASFNDDTELTVSLYIDDEYRDVITIDAVANQSYSVTFDDLFVLDYAKAEVIVEYDDDFTYDNEFVIYGYDNEVFNVQLVSENPRFLQSALLTLGNFKIDVPVAPDDATPMPIEYTGYDLYIFDGIEPEFMPADGSVWLINPPAIPGETELTLGTELTGDFTLSAPLAMPSSEEAILNHIAPSEITLSAYTFVSNYGSYEPVLMRDSDPVILTKDMDGQKLVIFTFSLHHSNLPIIPDYILLTYNLSRYSVQNMVEQFLFVPGDTINVRRKPSAFDITVETSGEATQYDTFPVTFEATTPGEYRITQTLPSGAEPTVDFFVRIEANQSNFDYDYGVLSDPIVPANTTPTDDGNRDTTDLIYILMGSMILIMLIEWGLHYNEHN